MSATSLVFSSMLSSPFTVSSTTNSHIFNVLRLQKEEIKMTTQTTSAYHILVGKKFQPKGYILISVISVTSLVLSSLLSMCSQWAFLHCLNLEMQIKEIQFHLIIHSFILLGFIPSTRFKNQTCDTGADCKIPQPIPDWWSEVAPEQSLSSSYNCCLCFPL